MRTPSSAACRTPGCTPLSFSLRREPGQGERDGSPVAQAQAEAQDGMTAEPEGRDARVMPGLRLLDIRA
jgi:hypothetical protein